MVMSGYENYKCMHCGSTELAFGYQGTSSNVFVPSGLFTFHGYKTRSYVCLQCGHLGHYMPKTGLDKLKERLKSRFEVSE